MIILCLYLCSITDRSTARLVISHGPTWPKSAGNPASVHRRRRQPSVAGAWDTCCTECALALDPRPAANPKVRDFPPGTGIPPGISKA